MTKKEREKKEFTDNLHIKASKFRAYQQELIKKYGAPVFLSKIEYEERAKYEELEAEYYKAKNSCFSFMSELYGII